MGVDPDPAKKEEISAWTKEYWNALHPYSSGGVYVNFMMEEGQERIRATYGNNYKRLAKIKKRYDPENLFQVIRIFRRSETERDWYRYEIGGDKPCYRHLS